MHTSHSLMSIRSLVITPMLYQGQRVLTFAQIDQVHERTAGTARKRFNDHKDRLLEGEDFFKVSPSEIRTTHPDAISEAVHSSLTVLTESGYLLLVKSFTDDLAWEVQKELVNEYFRKSVTVAKPLSLAEQALQSAQVLVALEQEQLRLAENQALLEAKTASLEASTATLESQIADLQIQHRNGIPLHHLSKSQAHHAYAKGLSEKVFHAFLAYAKIPTQEYTATTEDGQSVVTFAYLPESIPEALKSLVQNSTQVSACYCESKDLKLRFRCQQAAWLAN